MHFIENGERLPDYRMRNRIMARLGISSEEYEDFVQYDEYDRWLQCQSLIDYVEAQEKEKAEDTLKDLLSTSNLENKIEYQFLLDMKGRIMELYDQPWDTILAVYGDAVSLTMPAIDASNICDYILAPEEYYLLLKYLSVKAKCVSLLGRAAIFSYYQRICKNIRNNLQQAYASAKVYPMAVVGWSGIVDDWSIISDNDLKEIWEHSSNALEALRNAGRSYFLRNLLKIRQTLRVQIKARNLIIDEVDALEEHEQEWLDGFDKLYQQYATNTDINYSGFIYTSSEVYSISDIISSRRRMCGLTKRDLAGETCTDRTVIRIEKKQAKPQQFVVEKLFNKLGVTSDYIRAEILTNDYNTMELYSYYKHAMNDADYTKAYEIEQELHAILDYNYPENRQVMANMENNRKFRTGEIDKSRYLSNMQKILEMTLPKNCNYQPEDYISDIELTIMKNVAFGAEVQEYQEMLISKCDNYYRSHIRNHASSYELIMGTVASRYGDQGKYAPSNKISDFIIEEALRLFRPHAIHRNLFCIAWNNAMQSGKYFEKYLRDQLASCSAIADFCKDMKTAVYYNNKLMMFDEGKNWTS